MESVLTSLKKFWRNFPVKSPLDASCNPLIAALVAVAWVGPRRYLLIEWCWFVLLLALWVVRGIGMFVHVVLYEVIDEGGEGEACG